MLQLSPTAMGRLKAKSTYSRELYKTDPSKFSGKMLEIIYPQHSAMNVAGQTAVPRDGSDSDSGQSPPKKTQKKD